MYDFIVSSRVSEGGVVRVLGLKALVVGSKGWELGCCSWRGGTVGCCWEDERVGCCGWRGGAVG